MPDATASKTQRKRDMHALQELGATLTELSAERVDALTLPEDLAEALHEYRRIKAREARRRQLQYIGRLMRDVDPVPIRERLAAWKGESSRHTAWLHELERWRDRLVTDPEAITELKARHPGADSGRIRQLARNAAGDRNAGRAPRAYRELFRELKLLIPEPPPGGDAEQD
ncbi:MAG: ribosome biogenesis factor YjgA [Pseudomonadota bacterium]